MSRIYRKSMCTRCSLLCALLLPPHPHPPVPRRAVVPLQYDDIKIITFSLIQRPDSTTLISMFVPCIFCRLPNTDNRIRAFSQMQKTRKKCFSSDYTNTKCLDDVFSHHLSHTTTTHRHDVERELSACNSVNRRLFFLLSFQTGGVHHTIGVVFTTHSRRSDSA